MTRSFSSNLRGKVRNFALPKNRPLVPLYEAVVNSINAIEERAAKQGVFKGNVDIEVVRDSTLFTDSDKNTVRGFCIRDNGIGFDEDNMASFMEADSAVYITSTYKEAEEFVTRKFEFSLEHFNIEDVLEDAPAETDYCTEVKLIDYKKDYEKEVPKQLSTIAIRIIQHCFVYFLRENCPEIWIHDDADRLSLNLIFKERFSTADNKKTVIVGY